MKDMHQFERIAQADGYTMIAGIDEVGRGPLAGPVVTAAVILPLGYENTDINDSKALSEKKRERLYTQIMKDALSVAIDFGPVEEIDRINILQATWASMRRSVLGLDIQPDVVLVDGLRVPNLHSNARFIVKGDANSISIAAASIVAKVSRDRLMQTLGEIFPQYGFDKHKGYPSPSHLLALETYGPCPHHRMSFAPVAKAALRF